jgi:histidinol dehydrogenase
VDASILAALHYCGVTEVYAVGGVQAIATMAYGTETIRAVDKIFGPGNAYVCEAKRQVFGAVGVDLLPGPSEVLVIADATARPEWVASSLLAQAEHGTGGEKIYLLSTESSVLSAVESAIEVQLVSLTHAAKIRKVLDKNFCVLLLPGFQQVVDAANYIAPEHIELQVSDKETAKYAKLIVTAGAMFIGHYTPTVLGDFVAGPSHTLPTGRSGRFFSGLQVSDFMRRTSIVEYAPESLKKAAPVVAAFSAMEKLDAHGRSLTLRL